MFFKNRFEDDDSEDLRDQDPFDADDDSGDYDFEDEIEPSEKEEDDY